MYYLSSANTYYKRKLFSGVSAALKQPLTINFLGSQQELDLVKKNETNSLAAKITFIKKSDAEVRINVLIGFIIDADGAVTEIKILESTNTALNKEAIKIMEMCPKWLPGYQNGISVKVQYQVNLKFEPAK